ncbi:MarR family winged helix-turn-helix transcriptional regulator [Brevibacterium litoralis]|uniref:MarR family winged helix-turn-helix transcriptional regulator n=1 Tax=Brevibacterium litoralis TaxID=3138935 RepID=UPI0032EE3F07
MLPDPLIELFDARLAGLTGEDRDTDALERSEHMSVFVHAVQMEAMVMRTAMARFAQTNDLNLIDFQVLQSVVTLSDAGRTATPGYISSMLSMSASTLTSILERLVARGLLTRERDSADRRRISIYYTQTSLELSQEFDRLLAAAYEPFFARSSTEEIRDRTGFVQLMAESTQDLIDGLEAAD